MPGINRHPKFANDQGVRKYRNSLIVAIVAQALDVVVFRLDVGRIEER
ncbi:MAG: hypothetical protein P4L46_13150 [Fimbriimonas sp.]|nr:hypothetical protein [Fimbriimonas sp.]